MVSKPFYRIYTTGSSKDPWTFFMTPSIPVDTWDIFTARELYATCNTPCKRLVKFADFRAYLRGESWEILDETHP
jgi:hypothetical protein